MSRDTLRHHLSACYGAENLRPGVADRIRLRVTDAAREAPSTQERPSFSSRRALGAMALTLAAVVLIAWVASGPPKRPEAPLGAEFVAELAQHHHKRLDVEFVGADFATLRLRMPRLDFTLAAPSHPALGDLRLLGARYCSFRGSTVAQIALVDPQGEAATLYELRDPGGLAGAAAGEYRQDGLRIWVWSEGGLLMGLARIDPRPR